MGISGGRKKRGLQTTDCKAIIVAVGLEDGGRVESRRDPKILAW